MNKLLLGLNAVLLVAVAYLYYLHFGSVVPESTESASLPISTGSGSILFLNSDSLLDNYDYYKSKKADLEKRQDQLRTELKGASDKLERDVETYQQNAATLTPAQRQQAEESLMMRQQQLVQRKEQLLDQLDQEQARYSDSLFQRLTAYLKEYNKGRNIHFVLGYQRGGGILFANDSLNITGPVIKGLNARWKEEQE
jgi:outer membrane protein